MLRELAQRPAGWSRRDRRAAGYAPSPAATTPPSPLGTLSNISLPSAAQRRSFPAVSTAERLAGWKSVRASPTVLSWLRDGYVLPWSGDVPLPFNQGKSLRNLTEEQNASKQKLTQKLFDCGAFEPATDSRFISKAFLVPKKTAPGEPKKWRLVVDLRWINLHLRRSRCAYETLKRLHHLARPGDWLFSLDIEDGFYAVPVHKAHRKYLTVDLDGIGLVQFAALPMGLSSSPLVFTKVMRCFVQACRAPMALLRTAAQHAFSATPRPVAPCWRPPSPVSPLPTPTSTPTSARYLPPALRAAAATPRVLSDLLPRWRSVMQRGVRVLIYVDDLLFLSSSEALALEARGYVEALLALLGLRRNPSKGCWEPTQRLSPHLGLGIDTRKGEFFVPPERLQKLQEMASAVLGRASRHRGLVPRRFLASFCGLAQSLYLALPPARFMARSLFDALNSEKHSWSADVRLSSQAKTDLRWFMAVPDHWNGRALFRSPMTATLHCDASAAAWSGVLNERLEARGSWREKQMPEHITSKELRAVLFSVEAFMPHLQGRRVRLWEDNQAVVAVLTSWTSRSPLLMGLLRRLWWLLDTHDVSLSPAYIRSAANVWADHLSRLVDTGDWRLSSASFARVQAAWGPHTVDRFASINNALLPRYNSAWADPRTAGVDCFSQTDWTEQNNFCFPPVGELDRLAQLLVTTGAAATVVAPLWPAQAWFQVLQEFSVERLYLPPGSCLSPPRPQGSAPALAGRTSDWPLVAFRIPPRP